MKITIDKAMLLGPLTHVTKAVPTKTPLEVLKGVLLEATADGLTLAATDSVFFIETKFSPVDVKIRETGSIVLPAKLFEDVIKKMPDGPLDIWVDEGIKTTINNGKTKINMTGLDPEMFPESPKLSGGKTFDIQAEHIMDLVKRTFFALKKDDDSVLTGFHMVINGENIELSATDRHRFALRKHPIPVSFVDDVIIPGKPLIELRKIMDVKEMLKIQIGDDWFTITSSDYTIHSRYLNGTYPNLSYILKAQHSIKFSVKTSELIQALDRATLVVDDKNKIVRLTANDMGLDISAGSNENQMQEVLAFKSYEGDHYSVSCNAEYMKDAIGAIDTEYTEILRENGQKLVPLYLKGEDDDLGTYIVLPYRTH